MGEPADGTSCNAIGELCTYGSGECSCANQMGNPIWRCHVCPGAMPMTGDGCNDPGAKCVYGADECACVMGQWNCGTCPSAQPMNNDNCSGLEGLACAYGMTNCTCRLNGNWRCTDPCPASQPKPGDPCMSGLQFCDYGNVSCICIMGGYFCN